MIFNKRPMLAFYIKLILSLHASSKKKKKKIIEMVELVPSLHQHKGNRKKAWMLRSVCVFVHTRIQLEGLKNGFTAGSVNSRPGSCPLARLYFLLPPSVPSVSAEVLWNTTHQMRCDLRRHTVLFILDGPALWGKMQRSAHLLLDEVWWLSKPTKESV